MQMRRLELTGDQVGFSAIYSWDQFLRDFPAPGLPITVLKHVRGASSHGPGGALQCPAILESFTEWLFWVPPLPGFMGWFNTWTSWGASPYISLAVLHRQDFIGSASPQDRGAVYHCPTLEEPIIILASEEPFTTLHRRSPSSSLPWRSRSSPCVGVPFITVHVGAHHQPCCAVPCRHGGALLRRAVPPRRSPAASCSHDVSLYCVMGLCL
ncbi:PREDICTED: uncharacterized protein LOC104836286 [Haliaeetus leucocephalus]|nr:PREDICTED: uncharacterized protein LOC104836286 [Haliaeetus leucocephalus]